VLVGWFIYLVLGGIACILLSCYLVWRVRWKIGRNRTLFLVVHTAAYIQICWVLLVGPFFLFPVVENRLMIADTSFRFIALLLYFLPILLFAFYRNDLFREVKTDHDGDRGLNEFLRCPHCQRQAVEVWQFFVFPSTLFMSCRQCNHRLRFDFNTVRLMVYGSVFAVVSAGLIPIHSTIFAAPYMLLCTCYPVFLGKRLFLDDVGEKVDTKT